MISTQTGPAKIYSYSMPSPCGERVIAEATSPRKFYTLAITVGEGAAKVTIYIILNEIIIISE